EHVRTRAVRPAAGRRPGRRHRPRQHPGPRPPAAPAHPRDPRRRGRGHRDALRRGHGRVRRELLVPPAHAREVRLRRTRRAARQGAPVAPRRTRPADALRPRRPGVAARGRRRGGPRARPGGRPRPRVARRGARRGPAVAPRLDDERCVVLRDARGARRARARGRGAHRPLRRPLGRPLPATRGRTPRAPVRRRQRRPPAGPPMSAPDGPAGTTPTGTSATGTSASGTAASGVAPTGTTAGPAEDAAAGPARAALGGRAFRLLSVAWAFTNFADSVLAIILAVWVKDLTGSNGAAGLVFAALGLPALASPFLGQLADRVSRRRMLVGAYAVGALSVLALVAVRGPGQVWLVFVVTVLYSTVGFATAAAQSGLVRDMLPDDALAPANGR